MFNGRYLEWNRKRIKTIVDFYGHKYIYFKKVLDLGCGHGDIGGSLQRLGADVTYIDAREEHLKVTQKKFPGAKILKSDLENRFPLVGKKVDIILDLDLLCHMKNYEKHLREVCLWTTHLVLETAVCDSDDPEQCVYLNEDNKVYDLGTAGTGALPSAANIEKILSECGMEFRRIDDAKLNAGDYVYNWTVNNTNNADLTKRRLWFAKKINSVVKFAPIQKKEPVQPIVAPIVFPGSIRNVSKNITINTVKQNVNKSDNIFNTLSDRKFVVVIPSYNNHKYCERNILSALNQDYKDFRIIFTDDYSKDNTFERVTNIVNSHKNKDKCTLIKNTVRVGALENLYNMIHSCNDEEIVLTLDGDDWLANNNVLKTLNNYYCKEDIWMTYGQYTNHPMGGTGIAQEYPAKVIEANSFRQHTWGASHLRTFYSWLFKKIDKKDLMYQDKFLEMTWDFAIMFPMLEMSGKRSKFLKDILYVYNLENPINDHKVNQKLQQKLDVHLRNAKKYSLIDKPKPKVGLLLIATNKYDKFLQGLISSADRYFLNECDVTYYVFTDSDKKIYSKRNIERIKIEHKSFPFASMDRFMHFKNNKNLLLREEYLFYVDVDCLFVDFVRNDILGDLVGVQHCGYVNKKGPLEKNKKSFAYIDESNLNKYKTYFGGGFSGGKSENYIKLSEQCDNWKEMDLNNNIIPIWHDETLINKYFCENKPDIVLNPSYHYPQSNLTYYKNIWKQTFKPKILLLDKKHEEVRK